MTPIKKRREGLFDRIGLEIQVFQRLFLDRRMPLWIKLVPLAGLGYLVNPVDFPSLLDDIIILLISLVTFYEFAPSQLAEEHRTALRNQIDAEWRDLSKEEEIIDGQFRQDDQNSKKMGE